jgi:hypothetical protein
VEGMTALNSSGFAFGETERALAQAMEDGGFMNDREGSEE